MVSGKSFNQMDNKEMNEIITLRRRTGTTIAELAKAAGISRYTMTKYEKGVSSPRLSTVAKMRSHLLNKINEKEMASATA